MVNLVGVWRLKSIAFVAQETGERLDFNVADPFGYMVFDPTDRMLVLMTAGGRTPAESASQMASLFQSMGAYTGWWSIDGEKLVTEVDGAWEPSWVGTEQIRYCKFCRPHALATLDATGTSSFSGPAGHRSFRLATRIMTYC
jgi:hypothetical protein